MPSVAVAVFTRDLRIHDNPVLAAACASADTVVPVFALDEGILGSRFAAGNRLAFLHDCLTDLDASLRRRGAGLVLRRGDPVGVLARLAAEVDAASVHIAADHSGYAERRRRRLQRALGRRALVCHDSHTAVPPGEITPAGSDHYAVFTPYYRRWLEVPLRPVLDPPPRLRLPEPLPASVPLPPRARFAGRTSPDLPAGGEREGRRRAAAFLDGVVAGYAAKRDELAADATSRLSAYLHFGAISVVELIRRTGGGGPGVTEFVRQLAWRDFYAQLLAARPEVTRRDYRDRGRAWRDDEEALAAWRDGRTGVPLVDAGMRQLAHQGWMHNRARLVTASYLTRTLGIDWRLGAAHFFDLLVDGDLANNVLNWQWVAGTGSDTRPNRVLNPHRQAQRYDPAGAYIRRWTGLCSPSSSPPSSS